jgi:hypothetical protein
MKIISIRPKIVDFAFPQKMEYFLKFFVLFFACTIGFASNQFTVSVNFSSPQGSLDSLG